MIRRFLFLFLLPLIMLAGSSPVSLVRAQGQTPVVRAVLFYSPTCPHCEALIQEDLPPLYQTYGEQLQIIGVNTRESEGWELYQAAVERFSIPEDRRGVPTLIVNDTLLVGREEIGGEFPSIIEEGLVAGGISLPDFPELLERLPAEPDTSSITSEDTRLSSIERFRRDPASNTLAVVVLLGMIASVAFVAINGRRVFQQQGRPANPGPSFRDWVVPVLALVGLAVAGYMAYVEMSQIEAVCGPIGNCNTVQQSEYARLFGVLPIGLIGTVGYVAMLATWTWQHIRDNQLAWLALFGMAAFGTLFSIYLTFLEPFVIGATCAWCLTSAVIITVLLLLTAAPGLQAAQRVVGGPTSSTMSH